MFDFDFNLTKQVQDHPSLKALTITGKSSFLYVEAAVAAMSNRGSVEKLVVKGMVTLCRVSLSESPTCQLIVRLSCLCVWYGGTVWCMPCLHTLESLRLPYTPNLKRPCDVTTLHVHVHIGVE